MVKKSRKLGKYDNLDNDSSKDSLSSGLAAAVQALNPEQRAIIFFLGLEGCTSDIDGNVAWDMEKSEDPEVEKRLYELTGDARGMDYNAISKGSGIPGVDVALNVIGLGWGVHYVIRLTRYNSKPLCLEKKPDDRGIEIVLTKTGTEAYETICRLKDDLRKISEANEEPANVKRTFRPDPGSRRVPRPYSLEYEI